MADDIRARQSVSEMDRVELEDKHLRLLEENFLLKKHARSQEDKMKRMATKLLRLTADEKKEARKDIHTLTAAQLRQRDIETEALLGEFQQKVRELEKQNTSFKSKNAILRQHVEMLSRRRSPYDHVQSKITTGIRKKSLGSPAPVPEPKPVSEVSVVSVGVQFAGTCHNLLEGVRRDNQDLEDQLLQLKSQLLDKDAAINSTKEKLRLKSMQLEEEKLSAKQELQMQIARLEREKTDQEMELIRLQRELRDSSNRMQALRTKCSAAEKNLEAMKATHSKVLDEMEGLNADVKRERDKSSRLEERLTGHESDRHTISNLEILVEDLKRERDHLREASRNLTHKDEVHHVQHKAKLAALQEQVKQLEEAASLCTSDRGKTLKELAAERELSSRLDGDLRRVRETYNKLKKEYDIVKEKLKFFEKDTSLDWSEVEEALIIVKERKTNPPDITITSNGDAMREVEDLRVWHADTVNELEKTRKLLQMQHTINKDYKAEVESLKSELAKQRQAYESQLQEYVMMVDSKAARVKKLETQLKDIAYGTRPYRVDMSRFEYGGEGEDGGGLGDSVELERGQNLLQFHISQVTLSPEAVSCLATSSPALFVTFNFSDYETQVTPVLKGPRSNLAYTASYVVTVDDAFLQLLHKSCIHLEVNQAMGHKYRLLGVASVKCWEVVSGGSGGGKVHGKALLTGVESMKECVSAGSLEYWMKLKLPIAQAAKLYQDRSKAIASLKAPPTTAPTSLSTSQGPDYNELSITIVKCQGLPSKSSSQFPSAYVMYKLDSFPDHDTPIISHSASPVFANHHTYPLSMGPHLHHYLSTETLDVFVFDDDNLQEDYLGLAQVSLLPLAQGKPLSGTFQLKQPNGKSGGFIELSMKWKHPYAIQHEGSKASTRSNKTSSSVVKSESSKAGIKTSSNLKPEGSKASIKTSSSVVKSESSKSSGVKSEGINIGNKPETNDVKSGLSIPVFSAAPKEAHITQTDVSYSPHLQGARPRQVVVSSDEETLTSDASEVTSTSLKAPSHSRVSKKAKGKKIGKHRSSGSTGRSVTSLKVKEPDVRTDISKKRRSSGLTRQSSTSLELDSRTAKGQSSEKHRHSGPTRQGATSLKVQEPDASKALGQPTGQGNTNLEVREPDAKTIDALNQGSRVTSRKQGIANLMSGIDPRQFENGPGPEGLNPLKGVRQDVTTDASASRPGLSPPSSLASLSGGSVKVSEKSGDLTSSFDGPSTADKNRGETQSVTLKEPKSQEILKVGASLMGHLPEVSKGTTNADVSPVPTLVEPPLLRTGEGGAGSSATVSMVSVTDMSESMHSVEEELEGRASAYSTITPADDDDEEEEGEGDRNEDEYDEDTMFGDTDNLSGLSEHSSDLYVSPRTTSPPQSTPAPPAAAISRQQEGGAIAKKDEEEEEEESLTFSSSQSDGKPVTSSQIPTIIKPTVSITISPSSKTPLEAVSPPKPEGIGTESVANIQETPLPAPKNTASMKPSQAKPEVSENSMMSITVESFALEEGCSLARNSGITNIFVEYQFLDFDFGELETKSLPKPKEGMDIHFNFKKVFALKPQQETLLAEMLTPDSDEALTFTLVSDPEDPNADCEELGSASLDLNMILERNEDLINHYIDVLTPEDNPEVIGYLTVSVEALKLLKALKNR